MNIEDILKQFQSSSVFEKLYFSKEEYPELLQQVKQEIGKLTDSGVIPEEISFPDNSELGAIWECSLDVRDKTFIHCAFKDLDLSGWKMDFATFDDCVFENCVLPDKISGITYLGCSFINIRFADDSNPAWVDCSLLNNKFSHSKLDRLYLEHNRFENCQFEEVSFKGLNSTKNSSFYGCEFSQVDFTEGTFCYISIVNPGIFENVDFSGSSLVHFSGTGMEFSAKAEIKVENCDWSYANLEECVFENLTFGSSIFYHTICSECTFRALNFNSLNMKYTWMSLCALEGVTFEKCDISCCDFSSSTISRLYVNSCSGNMINLQKSQVADSCFASSDLKGSLLSYATMKNVVFDGCNLNLTRRHDVKEENFKLNGCSLTGATGNDEELFRAEHFY